MIDGMKWLNEHKKILLLLAVTVAAVLAGIWWFTSDQVARNRVRDFEAIARDGVLWVTTEYNASSYFVEGDSLVGFQHDLVKAFADAHQLKVEFLPEMSLEVRLDGVRSGDYDLIACNILRTKNKLEGIALTNPILTSKQVLVQRNLAHLDDSSRLVKSHLDLAGKTVHVVKDDPSVMRIHNLGSEIGDTIYVVEIDKYGPEQLIALVAYGEIDYYVCNDKIASQVIDSFPQLSPLTDIGFTQLYSWGVNEKATHLQDTLNVWLDSFKQSKAYRKIYSKYYGRK